MYHTNYGVHLAKSPLMNMSSEEKVVFVLVVGLSYGVILSGCEVVLVNRNVKDSFRVGKDGCTNDTSVCDVPNRAATCQPDSGLCLCPDGVPNFRNPIVKSSGGSLQHGNTYGCVENAYVRLASTSVSEIPTTCLFAPFKVIPYNDNDPVTKFSHDRTSETLQSCSLLKAWAKFPNNYIEVELHWLNESYVDLNIKSNYMLEFRWKKSVPDLQGTIITFSLKCYTLPSSYGITCLRAKVLGMWPADTSQTQSTPATTKPTSSTVAMETSQTSSANSSPGKVASSDDDSNITITAIAVVIPVVLLIVLVVVIWLFCRRKNRHREGSINKKKNASEPATSLCEVHYHKDEPAKSIPDIERIEVNGDLYAIPEKNKNNPKDNGLKYLDPSALNLTNSKEENGMQSHQPTEYANIVGVMKAKTDSETDEQETAKSAGCQFAPFQVIPYSHDGHAVTEFYYNDKNITFQNCSFLKAWAKFPDNFTTMELLWLNESYVDLRIRSNNTLDFKWKRSVPGLQGTIITFNLECSLSTNSSDLRRCLQAKVLGTWSTNQTQPTPAATKPINFGKVVAIVFLLCVVGLTLPICLYYGTCHWMIKLCKKRRRKRSTSRTNNAYQSSPSVIHRFREDTRVPPPKATPVKRDSNVIQQKNEKKLKDNGFKSLEPSALRTTNSEETNGTRFDYPTGYDSKPYNRHEGRDSRAINHKSEGSFGKESATKPSTSQAATNIHGDAPAKSTPDSQRDEVNGNLYSSPERNKNKPMTISLTTKAEKGRDSRAINHKSEGSLGKESATKPSTSQAATNIHVDAPEKSTPDRDEVNGNLYSSPKRNKNKPMDCGPSASTITNSKETNEKHSDHRTTSIDKSYFRSSPPESKDKDGRSTNHKSEGSFGKESPTKPSTSQAATNIHGDAPAKSTPDSQRDEVNENLYSSPERNKNKPMDYGPSASTITNSKEINEKRSDHRTTSIDQSYFRSSPPESKDKDGRATNHKSEESFGKKSVSEPPTSENVTHFYEDAPGKLTPDSQRGDVNGNLYKAKVNCLKRCITAPTPVNDKEINEWRTEHRAQSVNKQCYRWPYHEVLNR